jgi:hypothetical protein
MGRRTRGHVTWIYRNVMALDDAVELMETAKEQPMQWTPQLMEERWVADRWR